MKDQVFKLIRAGLTDDKFLEYYRQYYCKYCDYTPAYSSKCGSEKNAKTISTFSVKYSDVEYNLCENHSKKKCSICGKPAVMECSFSGQYVCGAPLCPNCYHTHYEKHFNKGST